MYPFMSVDKSRGVEFGYKESSIYFVTRLTEVKTSGGLCKGLKVLIIADVMTPSLSGESCFLEVRDSGRYVL